MSNYRIRVNEVDLSGFTTTTINVTGAMVLKGKRGRGDKPIKFKFEQDVITYSDIPTADYPSLYEAIAYTRSADLWAVFAIGSGAVYGGMDITSSGAHGFFDGRQDVTNFNYSSNIAVTDEVLLNSGAVVTDSLNKIPYTNASLAIKVGGSPVTATETGGVITGAGITGSGTVNPTTGAIAFTLATYTSGTVTASYQYSNSNVSHSFFTSSQCTDFLKADISHVSGYQFNLTLYKLNSKGFYEQITDYDYSLAREKSTDGSSLYIEDVFENNAYVIPKVNSSFVLSSTVFNSFVDTTSILFTGGARGADPTDAEVNTAWDFFKKPNKYKSAIFMDVFGTHTNYINTLIQTYQPYAFGISVIPYGTADNADDDVTYRGTLALDTDDVALYTNWMKIREPYQNQYVWISNVGSVGRRYVAATPSYNFESPAGTNTNGYGGQLSDWTYVEAEKDYTSYVGGDTENLDNAQINPIILDPVYGVIIQGDKTLQVTNTDTSFVGARRGYNYILETIETQVLRSVPFKINNDTIRTQIRVQTESVLTPILVAGYIREFVVVCDESNNTDEVLARRELRLDVYEKIAPNIQRILFTFTKVGQTQVIAELLP